MATTLSAEPLRNRLAAFDGNAVSYLSELQAQDPDPETLTERLIQVLGDADEMVQRGATWILFDQMKAGASISEADWRRIADRVIPIGDWQAALHLLQMLSFQSPPADTSKQFADFAAPYLEHKRPFLRAWSISALVTLASEDSELTETARKAVQIGLADPAASVRARARKVEVPA